MSREAGLAIVEEHLQRLEPLQIKGSWLHGSLVLGGYHHGISDQDLVVELSSPLTPQERELVDDSHRQAGRLLAASYLDGKDDPDPPTWTHGWSGTRRVSLITRAELHLAHPDDWPEIPDVPGVVMLEVRKAWLKEPCTTYLKTEYVDLSLTSIARALLTQETGALTSKDEAIERLDDFGVPNRLVEAIRTRRQGRESLPHNRFIRAWQTRKLVQQLLGSEPVG